MSSQTIILQNGSQGIINQDVSKIFVGNPRFEQVTYLNDSYAEATLVAGTLMRRLPTAGYVVPFESADNEPVLGVLAEDITVDDGATKSVYICVSGDVVSDKIVLQGSDTLDTVSNGRRIRDRIGADTVGIKLVGGTEMTAYDNQ